MIRFSIIIFLGIMYTNFVSAQSSDRDPVVAHRGAWKAKKLPENSLASLRHAIEMGCIASEFDARMTADGVLVVNHDPEYHGMAIEKVNYTQLEKFNLENGEKLPTLMEYLQTGRKNNFTTRLVLEIKPSEISTERGKVIAKKVLEIVNKSGASGLVDYISFDLEILKTIVSIAPGTSTQYLTGDKSPDDIKALGISGLDYHYKVYYKNPEWIAQSKQLGLTLNVWTVNEPKDLDFFLNQPFDFITTNEPELIYKKIRKSAPLDHWKMIFRDEFDGAGLPNEAKWNYDKGGHGWGNNEKQYYLEKSIENAYIKDGNLHITALEKPYEKSPYTSAKLTTYERFLMQYGKVEVRAKLPKGRGTWPAIWMLPQSIRTNEENWPLCGEIDIMEHVGKDPNVVHTSLHSEMYNHILGTQITHYDTLTDVFENFHTYGMEWDEKSIKFIYDGQVYFQSFKGQDGRNSENKGWPFDKPYYLILNLAIGGNWGGEIDPAIFPCTMVVDYVRVYQKMH